MDNMKVKKKKEIWYPVFQLKAIIEKNVSKQIMRNRVPNSGM